MDLEAAHSHALMIAQAADDKQGEDIVIIDVHENMPFSDYFVIVSADNERKVKAIADEIDDRMNEAQHKVKRSEGRDEFRWVLMDFGDVIAHIFHNDAREYYALDKLWKDCPTEIFEGEQQ